MSSSIKYGSGMSLINRNMAIEIAQDAFKWREKCNQALYFFRS